MIAYEPLFTNTGYPYAGPTEVPIAREEVAALGKLTAWGSSVIHFVLKLRDGRNVMIRANEQAKDDERWLRRLAKPVKTRLADRATGWCVAWGAEVQP